MTRREESCNRDKKGTTDEREIFGKFLYDFIFWENQSSFYSNEYNRNQKESFQIK